jgi:mRNA interferase MazF
MARGEIWWVVLDEKRPVVLLSPDEDTELRAVQVVAPAGVDLTGVGIEVRLGAEEGLAQAGVVRVALPADDFIPCTWLVTVTCEDLIEQAGTLSPAKLREVTDMLQVAGIE